MTILPLAKIGILMNLVLLAFFAVAILLIIVVLIQKGKGGGLSSAFGGGGAGGVLGAKSAGPMMKFTVGLMFLFLALAVVLNKYYRHETSKSLQDTRTPVSTQPADNTDGSGQDTPAGTGDVEGGGDPSAGQQ